jgi:hypothetical protein
VVVTDTSLTAALLLGEWLRQAIYPLEWCHVYSPVAPADVATDLLQCPAPYFLGILRSTLRDSPQPPPADALVVDLDTGLLQVPPSLRAALRATKPLAAELSRLLRPAYHTLDCVEDKASGKRCFSTLLVLAAVIHLYCLHSRRSHHLSVAEPKQPVARLPRLREQALTASGPVLRGAGRPR